MNFQKISKRGGGGGISDLKNFIANLVLVEPVCGKNWNIFSKKSSVLESAGFPKGAIHSMNRSYPILRSILFHSMYRSYPPPPFPSHTPASTPCMETKHMVEQATNSSAFEQTKTGKQKVNWFVCTGVMRPSSFAILLGWIVDFTNHWSHRWWCF